MKLNHKKPEHNRRHSKKAGLPPGTLVFTGEQKIEATRITYIDYDNKNITEKQVEKIEECFQFKDSSTVTWINIDGLHDVDIIEKIGNQFGLHPLILEDILNTEQRAKFEDYHEYAFIILKMLSYNDNSHLIETEQVSLVLGHNYVISFQERIGDVFDQIRDRLRNSKGRIRNMGSDYLAYALIDSVVDNYFTILEKLGDKIENMEDELIDNPTEKTMQKIHSMKREMISLRKSIWPLREMLSNMQRSGSKLINKSTDIFLRDVYDHTIQIIDTIESFRDMVSGMLDIYLSSISNRMNSVMKVLTIIATIFIPLTFIAGVYGMNFDYMPETKWHWGYFIVLLIMLIITAGMIYYFRKKKWL